MANETMVMPVVGVWQSIRSAGVWSQAIGFVLVRFGRNLDSVVVKMFFTFNLLKKKFYKF
jgi:hypothetical protein